MVKPWEDALREGIKISKYRIQHHEKHGNGNSAMEDKKILLKQQKKFKDMNYK